MKKRKIEMILLNELYYASDYRTPEKSKIDPLGKLISFNHSLLITP